MNNKDIDWLTEDYNNIERLIQENKSLTIWEANALRRTADEIQKEIEYLLMYQTKH